MIPLKKALTTTVGKKILMALSGLGLVGFVIVHLLGNLTLFQSDGAAFNAYAHALDSLGVLKLVAEFALIGIFGLHIYTGLTVKAKNSSARPVGYSKYQSKGGPSLSNPASRNMIVTGLVILGFLVLHIWQFRFGPGMDAGYVAELKGESIRDLHRLVVETFQNPLFAGIYAAVMLLLGAHLRHGFWSAFQSLGAMNARYTKSVYALGLALAAVLAVGFLAIPFWIYFGGAQ
jgi:succinate dehydrogenase / fumarate reductase cytochrome b subunit